ncbi:MAG: histone H1 [Chloroflexota bacterium]|nr:histone H1 [Chloroflexota bacterium]
MEKRKRPRDVNQLAKWIVDESTGQHDPEPPDTRDPLAVELGRRGGLKGGPARAAKLTPEQRSESARKAAAKRWGAKPE